MPRLRRMLASVAALWLACQLGVLAAVFVPVSHHASSESTECTCPIRDHASCPMHGDSSSSSSSRCRLQRADTSAAAVFSAVVGVTGVLPTAATIDSADASVMTTSYGTTRRSRSIPPDLPPPRA